MQRYPAAGLAAKEALRLPPSMFPEEQLAQSCVIKRAPIIFALRQAVGDRVHHDRVDAEADMARRHLDILSAVMAMLAPPKFCPNCRSMGRTEY